jgi:carbon-monoxide dehydrogenase medium subunit
MQSAFEVALEGGELLEAISIPKISSDARWGYYKVCRKVGEFATAMSAVLIDQTRSVFRVTIGATAGRPIVIADANRILKSQGGGWALSNIDDGIIENELARRGINEPSEQQTYLTALRRALAKADVR